MTEGTEARWADSVGLLGALDRRAALGYCFPGLVLVPALKPLLSGSVHRSAPFLAASMTFGHTDLSLRRAAYAGNALANN